MSDEPDLTSVLREILELEGCEVRTVPTIGAALLAVRRERTDVILVDGSLHGARERALLAALRTAPAPPPVIVLSSVAEDVANGLDEATVLAKPMHVDDLVAAVRATASLRLN